MAVPAIFVFLFSFVVLLGILGVAVFEHVSAMSLSLPIAPTLTTVTIALPIVAVANAVYLHLSRLRQQQYLAATGEEGPKSLLWTDVPYGRFRLPGLPTILQVLQAIVTVATAAILIVNNIAGAGADGTTSSSPLVRCALETTWQRLYSAHDAAGLRRIQDALNCCGFNSVVDRAWPFPHGSGSATCVQSYGRTMACRVPWMQAVQRRAGVELGVVGLVTIFQVLTLLVRVWPALSFGQSYADQQDIVRPLLEDRPVEAYAEPYADDEDDGADEGGHDANGTNAHASNNKSQNNGPRLEPSGLHNAWAAE